MGIEWKDQIRLKHTGNLVNDKCGISDQWIRMDFLINGVGNIA